MAKKEEVEVATPLEMALVAVLGSLALVSFFAGGIADMAGYPFGEGASIAFCIVLLVWVVIGLREAAFWIRGRL